MLGGGSASILCGFETQVQQATQCLQTLETEIDLPPFQPDPLLVAGSHGFQSCAQRLTIALELPVGPLEFRTSDASLSLSWRHRQLLLFLCRLEPRASVGIVQQLLHQLDLEIYVLLGISLQRLLVLLQFAANAPEL